MPLKETLVAKPATHMVCDWLTVPAGGLPCCFDVRPGEYLFAIMTLILSSVGLYIFANRKAYARRYVYPGLAGMGLFVLFPLICTIAIAFTNYSSTNQLTFERAQQVLMDRSFRAGKAYNFTLIPAGDEWRLALTDGESGKTIFLTPLNLAASRSWR